MSSWLMILLIIFTNISGEVIDPVYLDGQPDEVIIENGVLKGNISASKELPKEFYGTWSVSSKIISTNDPILFKEKGADIWTLEKNDKIITLSNPVSGATASITVNEVNGKTATFTRKKFTDKYKEYETPKITIEGDNFYGTDTLVIEHYKNGKYIRTSVVQYLVTGTKISGPTLEDIMSR